MLIHLHKIIDNLNIYFWRYNKKWARCCSLQISRSDNFLALIKFNGGKMKFQIRSYSHAVGEFNYHIQITLAYRRGVMENDKVDRPREGLHNSQARWASRRNCNDARRSRPFAHLRRQLQEYRAVDVNRAAKRFFVEDDEKKSLEFVQDLSLGRQVLERGLLLQKHRLDDDRRSWILHQTQPRQTLGWLWSLSSATESVLNWFVDAIHFSV